jgi:hypothetical protein
LLGKLFSYFRHSFDPENFRLVMTILVKDEADIIESNIRVHSALGVDSFLVMDHMSSDGTREILESLKNQYDLHIVEQKDPIYQQSKWVSGMAFQAGKDLKADWVISNDADEFWLPQGKDSLKEVLAFKGACLTCDRFNMVLDSSAMADDYNFYDSTIRVDNPIYYRDTDLKNNSVSVILSKINPKAIVNPNGLIKLKGGSHGAKHIGNLLKYKKHYDRIKRFGKINIYHFPFRGYSHFHNKIKHRKALLSSGKDVRMGHHYHRWVEMLDNNVLKDEYAKFIFSEEEITVLKKFGVLVADLLPGKIIKQVLNRT